MTIAVSNSHRAGFLPAIAKEFIDKVAEIAGSAIRRREENKVISHLLCLSEHQLRDIGLQRLHIVAAIRGRPALRMRGHDAGY